MTRKYLIILEADTHEELNAAQAKLVAAMATLEDAFEIEISNVSGAKIVYE